MGSDYLLTENICMVLKRKYIYIFYSNTYMSFVDVYVVQFQILAEVVGCTFAQVSWEGSETISSPLSYLPQLSGVNIRADWASSLGWQPA